MIVIVEYPAPGCDKQQYETVVTKQTKSCITRGEQSSLAPVTFVFRHLSLRVGNARNPPNHHALCGYHNLHGTAVDSHCQEGNTHTHPHKERERERVRK